MPPDRNMTKSQVQSIAEAMRAACGYGYPNQGGENKTPALVYNVGTYYRLALNKRGTVRNVVYNPKSFNIYAYAYSP